jgi:NADH-quinone oxidoreductase subunit C
MAYGELTLIVARQRIIVPRVDLPARRQGLPLRQLHRHHGADYPEREQRFDVVYHLLSPYKNRRIRVKVEAGETDDVPSAFPCSPAPTGSSARPSTCTASCSRATRTSAAC